MERAPKDGYMLLSFLNTKLRDGFASLEELCAELELDQNELVEKMEAIGYAYDAQTNRFH